MLQAGIAHAQFETLHPYADGNGRVGRALIHAVLLRRGLTKGASLPISLALLTRSDKYVAGLTQFRSGLPQGLNIWLNTFLDAVRGAMEYAKELSEKTENLREEWLAQFRSYYANNHERAPRNDSLSIRIIEALAAIPVLDLDTLVKQFDCSRNTATKAANELVECGIIKQVSTRRNSKGWIQPDLLDLIVQGERKLGSTQWNTQLSAPNRVVPDARPAKAHGA